MIFIFSQPNIMDATVSIGGEVLKIANLEQTQFELDIYFRTSLCV